MGLIIKLLLGIAFVGTIIWQVTYPTTPALCQELSTSPMIGTSWSCKAGVVSIRLSSKTHSPVDITSTEAVGVWVETEPAPMWTHVLKSEVPGQNVGPGYPLRIEDSDNKLLYVRSDGNYVLSATFANPGYPINGGGVPTPSQ